MACTYASWTDGDEVRDQLKAIPQGVHVTVVGHSYGADTAFDCLSARTVDVLISMDPVASFRNEWTQIRPRCGTWLNVRAQLHSRDWDRSDYIAMLGGKYGWPPAPGQPGAPNYAYIAATNHGRFDVMMRTGAVSGRMLLGGNPVA